MPPPPVGMPPAPGQGDFSAYVATPGGNAVTMYSPEAQGISHMPSAPSQSDFNAAAMPTPQATAMPAMPQTMPQPAEAFGTAPSSMPVYGSPAAAHTAAAPPASAMPAYSALPSAPGQAGASSLPVVPASSHDAAGFSPHHSPHHVTFQDPSVASTPTHLSGPLASAASTPSPFGMASAAPAPVSYPGAAPAASPGSAPGTPSASGAPATPGFMMPTSPYPPAPQSTGYSAVPQSTGVVDQAMSSHAPPPSELPGDRGFAPVQAAESYHSTPQEAEEIPQVVAGFPVPTPKKRFAKKTAEQAARAHAGGDEASEPLLSPEPRPETYSAPAAAAPATYPAPAPAFSPSAAPPAAASPAAYTAPAPAASPAPAPTLEVPASPYPPAPQSSGARLGDSDQRVQHGYMPQASPAPAPAAPVGLPAPSTTPAYSPPAVAPSTTPAYSPPAVAPSTTPAYSPPAVAAAAAATTAPAEGVTTPMVPYGDGAGTSSTPATAPAPASAEKPAEKPPEAAAEPEADDAWHPGPLERPETGSELPEDFKAFPGWKATPGFTAGRWKYICVDPGGIRLRRTIVYTKKMKSGGELNFGEYFDVCEKGEEGGRMWLCLADGRGWAIERTNRRRCSEVISEEIRSQPGKAFMVKPSLGRDLDCRPTPVTGTGAAVNGLPPGSTAVIRERVSVISQRGSKGEEPRIFFKVYCEDRKAEGWIPEYDLHGQPSLVDFEIEKFNPESPVWISVTASQGTPIFPYPGWVDSIAKKGQRVGVGDIAPTVELCTSTDHLRFYRLADGGWITDTDPKNKRQMEQVTREEHWWQYCCVDKEGAAIRNAPTRSHAMNTGKKLKHRQRTVCSEIVKFPSGDSFIHIEAPNDGWVPVVKIGGDVKMKPLSPIDPKSRQGQKGGMKGPCLGPTSFGPPGSKGPKGPPMKGPPMKGPPMPMGKGPKGPPMPMGKGPPSYGAPPGPGYGAPPGPGYGKGPQGPPPSYGGKGPASAPVSGGAFGIGAAAQGPPMGQAGYGAPQGQYGMGPPAGHRGSDFGIN